MVSSPFDLYLYGYIFQYYTAIMIKCQYIRMNIFLGGLKLAYYKRLRDLREDNDYTQKEIADLLYTTQPQYYRYESGQRDLPCELVIMLAKFYNVSVDYILGLTDKPVKLDIRQ